MSWPLLTNGTILALQAEGQELRIALEESYAAFDEMQRGKGALAEEALSQSKGIYASIEEMQLRDEAELLTSSFSSQRAGSSSLSPVQVNTVNPSHASPATCSYDILFLCSCVPVSLCPCVPLSHTPCRFTQVFCSNRWKRLPAAAIQDTAP